MPEGPSGGKHNVKSKQWGYSKYTIGNTFSLLPPFYLHFFHNQAISPGSGHWRDSGCRVLSFFYFYQFSFFPYNLFLLFYYFILCNWVVSYSCLLSHIFAVHKTKILLPLLVSFFVSFFLHWFVFSLPFFFLSFFLHKTSYSICTL